jgi:hypothetical protein
MMLSLSGKDQQNITQIVYSVCICVTIRECGERELLTYFLLKRVIPSKGKMSRILKNLLQKKKL